MLRENLICKLCGEILWDGWLKHMVEKHKDVLMKEVKKVPVVCGKCGEVFWEVPNPVVDLNGEVKWLIPAYCKKCAGPAYHFLVKYVEPYMVKFKRRRKRGRGSGTQV